MKKIAIILVGLIVMAFVKKDNEVVETSKLIVEIKNVQSTKGTIYMSVYKDNGGFPEKGKHIYRKSIKPSKPVTEIVFEVPYGEYAVATYQDVNSNDKLDKNFVGFPKEPFGFSKNFKPVMSKPEFEDCSFKVDQGEKKITISLID